MQLLPRLALSALEGALVGAVAGLVVAVLALGARQARNAFLHARGQVGYKDCVLNLAFVPVCAALGAAAATVTGLLVPAPSTAALGALVPAVLLLLVTSGGALAQALRG